MRSSFLAPTRKDRQATINFDQLKVIRWQSFFLRDPNSLHVAIKKKKKNDVQIWPGAQRRE